MSRADGRPARSLVLTVACEFCEAAIGEACDPRRLAPGERYHGMRLRDARAQRDAAKRAAAQSTTMRAPKKKRRPRPKTGPRPRPAGLRTRLPRMQRQGDRTVDVTWRCRLCGADHPTAACPTDRREDVRVV